MSLSDPIADMLTRIRNAARINRDDVNIRASKICSGIAAVLKTEGYIKGYDLIEDNKQGILRVNLKYDAEGRSAIETIKRISKPGRRIYSPVEDLPYVLGGLGILIVSTSKGILSGKSCREQKVSGEILCSVS
ncbi:MAG: 30S ribosomal protein S8 [Planctomycetes bacterium]|nr:30S ribosomal protein S8 [Planctomycetota bacterium]